MSGRTRLIFENFLGGSALLLGASHTLMGPDHYLPLASVAIVRRWSVLRTLWLTTLLCMVHLSLSAGLIALGIKLHAAWPLLTEIEAVRQTGVGIFLLVCGLVCLIWAYRARHTQQGIYSGRSGQFTFWMVFVALLLGPCEILVPLTAAPIATGDFSLVWRIVFLFCLSTLCSMLFAVLLLSRLPSISSSPLIKMQGVFALLPGGIFLICGYLVLSGF